MGISLSRAAQWTTSSSGTCRLELSRLNQTLLEEVLRLVEQFGSRHPREAEYEFEEPLWWKSAVVASDFKTDDDISDSATDENNGKSQPGPDLLPVRSFNQISAVLHRADEKKVEEVRACLEENRDILVKILGRGFASDWESEDVEDIKEEDPAQDSEVKTKLFLLLKNMDKEILSRLLQEISQQVKLDPTAVKNEVQSLERFCGEEDERLLESLRYTSDFEFSNGCRSPLWRQLHGEFFYLVVEPRDTDILHITCSKDGVFLNAGIKEDIEESGYERRSDVYEDLAALLKSRSPHYAENINKQAHQQDFAVEELPSTQETQHVESVDGEEQLSTCYEEQEKNVHEEERQQQDTGSEGEKYETCPSWDWRKLGLMPTWSNAEEKKPSKISGEEKKRAAKGANSKMKAESFLPGRISSLKIKSSAGAMPVEVFSESSSESDEEEEPERRPESNTDLPSEYWQIQKLVKYLKGGNQTATVLTLCALMDFDLMLETCQLAIRDVGGLEVLINLLDTDEVKCKIGSLKILRKISHNMQICRTIVDMGGLQRVVKILDSPVKELKALAAETIANVARFRRARRTVRQCGGINKLVKLLDCTPQLAQQTGSEEKDVEVARCGASALWSCSRSTKNKEAIRRAGGVPLLGHLLKSEHEDMLIPVVGTLQECASEESYRMAIQMGGMIKDLVKNLSSGNDELQMHCASAIFKCAEDMQTRYLVRKFKGLQPLVSLLSKAANKQLLAAATGAIWKCSISEQNVARFQEVKALETLVGLLTDQPEEVLVNVVGALGEFAQIPANRATIRKCGGIKPLIDLLTGTNQALLVNVTKAVGACATDKNNMTIIDELDGVRLVWSLLKNPSADVQASAAWALCPCIENAKDAGDLVCSLVGGLELIVNLLKSTNNEVLASICSAIATIAKDKEILAVLTDHGVVPLLAGLTNTTDDKLRRHLAEAIGHCCMWGSNRASFGDAAAVAPLVRYLKSKDIWVHKSTAMALYQLSKDPNNCRTMHERGVVEPLIHLMGSNVGELQEFSAGCTHNIRMLAQANQEVLLYKDS